MCVHVRVGMCVRACMCVHIVYVFVYLAVCMCLQICMHECVKSVCVCARKRERESLNSKLKTLFYKDCSLRSVKTCLTAGPC